jgi:hypothetical protein
VAGEAEWRRIMASNVETRTIRRPQFAGRLSNKMKVGIDLETCSRDLDARPIKWMKLIQCCSAGFHRMGRAKVPAKLG